MFKRILIPTDGSEPATKSLRYGIGWAKYFDGTIICLYVIDIKLLESPIIRDIATYLGTTPWTNYQNQIRQFLEEKGRQVLDISEKECSENNIQCEKIIQIGLVPKTIVEHSELCDLVIIGKSGEHSKWLEDFIGGTTYAIIRKTRRPVVLTTCSSFTIGDILIAYDMSPSARESLRVSSELAKQWNTNCHIVHVSSKGESEALEEASNYLKSKGVSFNAHLVKNSSPLRGILEIYEETKPAIVAIGAFGKKRVQEWIVGSTTVSIIHSINSPILLTRLN
ncbi:MAG: universal stress protein [Candidatus Hydrogenedentes bacterium]|nr:universal stress protein [Candidatus Hydrogenedentota bacterium]